MVLMMYVVLFTVIKDAFITWRKRKTPWTNIPSYLPDFMTACQCCLRSVLFRLLLNS